MTEPTINYIYNPFTGDDNLPMALVMAGGRTYMGGFAGFGFEDDCITMKDTMALVLPITYMEMPNRDGNVVQAFNPVHAYNPTLDVIFIKPESFYLLKNDDSSDKGLVQAYEGFVNKMRAMKSGIYMPDSKEVSNLVSSSSR
jgi:hypothetical protein